jgi:hypothetical protein
MAVARDNLPEELIEAGAALLATTDALGMQAQGAMWVYSHLLQDWRYYLVTSLVDSLGRRRTYKLLIEAFEKVKLPDSMTIEDVHLGSPSDPFFKLLKMATGVFGFGQGRLKFEGCLIENVPFDGLVYRTLGEPPSAKQAERIEKVFSKRVRDLVSTAG